MANVEVIHPLVVSQTPNMKASEGGRVVGKEEIRAYWSRQWKEFNPHVEPIEVIGRRTGKIDVRVHQHCPLRLGHAIRRHWIGLDKWAPETVFFGYERTSNGAPESVGESN